MTCIFYQISYQNNAKIIMPFVWENLFWLLGVDKTFFVIFLDLNNEKKQKDVFVIPNNLLKKWFIFLLYTHN
jgi:hypothetical protein